MPEVKKTQSQIIVELVADVELFHDRDRHGYATVNIGGHTETHALSSGDFRAHLRKLYYDTEGKPPSHQATQDARNLLEAKALFDGPELEVHTRVAPIDDGLMYFDLCNPQWEVVEVSRMGWKIVSSAPVKFRRARGMQALPYPEPGGDISVLREFLNIEADDDFILVVSFVIAALRGRGPFPILVLGGEQGSAKSTACRLIRELIDPNSAPLRRLPRDERDVWISAKNSNLISFDNVSYLPDWLSDCLCSLSTGGGFGTRQLYEDDQEVLFDSMRPLLLNGIGSIATRGDLLDRSLIVTLPVIDDDKRQEESSFYRRFNYARPRLLGALLDTLSTVLRTEEGVTLSSKPRMADFARVAVAATEGLPWDAGAFLSAYRGNRQEANAVTLESSLVAEALLELAEERHSILTTSIDLLEDLGKMVTEKQRDSKVWPKSAKGMGNALKRLAPALRRAGIDVTFGGRSGASGSKGRRLITIERVGNKPSPSSPSSHPCTDSHLQGEGKVSVGEDTFGSSPTLTASSPSKPLKTKAGEDSEDSEDRSLPFPPRGMESNRQYSAPELRQLPAAGTVLEEHGGRLLRKPLEIAYRRAAGVSAAVAEAAVGLAIEAGWMHMENGHVVR